jgi:hypothetical protein
MTTMLNSQAPFPVSFFIVGFSRSGTTLAAALMNRHSQICVPPETRFCRGVPRCGQLDIKERSHRCIGDRVFKYWRTADLNVDRTRFDDIFARYAPNYSNALACLLECYRRPSGKPRVGEKSPIHLFYVAELLCWFPGARVFCLIRDGRDVVNSMTNAPFTHNHLPRHAAEWAFLSRMARILSEKHPYNFSVVRYEDLVLDTSNVLASMCRGIGEEFEASQLLASAGSGVVPDWERNWKDDATKDIDPSKIGTWKNAFSSDALVFLHQIMGKELKYWQYDVPDQIEGAKLKTRVIRLLGSPFCETPYAIFRAFSDRARVRLCQLGLKRY